MLIAFLALWSLDLLQAPADQWSARFLVGAIHLYQATLSPAIASTGVRCRFEPSCSHYAEGAILRDGTLVGPARTAWRLLRCGPWTPAGTFDPP